MFVTGVKTYTSNSGIADENLNVDYTKRVFRTLLALIYCIG